MTSELLLQHPVVTYFCFALFTLAMGSLLNVVIYRLPVMLQTDATHECQNLLNITAKTSSPSINLFLPRSFCPACKKQVKSWHNIPLISYILLRGRCSTCKKRISLRYPLVELSYMLLSLGAAWHWGFSFSLIFILLFIFFQIALFFIDLEHEILPDCLTLTLLWLGLIANDQTVFIDLSTAVYSAIGGYLSLWLFIKLYYLLTGKIGMGNGDFKLFAGLGAWFGWEQFPFILLVSALSGATIGIIYLKLSGKTKDTPIPFGPFLCITGMIVLFLN